MFYEIKSTFLFCFLLFCFNFKAQQNKALDTHVLRHEFSKYKVSENQKRKVLNLQDAKFITKINPLTYLSVGLIFIYQNVFSEQISAKCSYEISCSEFTKKAIEKHGLIHGALIGFHQLSNCIPRISQEYPSYLVTEEELIINVDAF